MNGALSNSEDARDNSGDHPVQINGYAFSSSVIINHDFQLESRQGTGLFNRS